MHLQFLERLIDAFAESLERAHCIETIFASTISRNLPTPFASLSG